MIVAAVIPLLGHELNEVLSTAVACHVLSRGLSQRRPKPCLVASRRFLLEGGSFRAKLAARQADVCRVRFVRLGVALKLSSQGPSDRIAVYLQNCGQ